MVQPAAVRSAIRSLPVPSCSAVAGTAPENITRAVLSQRGIRDTFSYSYIQTLFDISEIDFVNRPTIVYIFLPSVLVTSCIPSVVLSTQAPSRLSLRVPLFLTDLFYVVM